MSDMTSSKSALAELETFFIQKDTASALEKHQKVKEEIKAICKDLEHELDEDKSEIDAEEREQIREAYKQKVQNDIQALKGNDANLGEFPERVETIQDDLEDILRSPQAEAVVSEIVNWLLGTGCDPPDQERQASLREIVKTDIETARQAVHDARSAHQNLRGNIGEAQPEIDSLILLEIRNAESVRDLERLANSLIELEENWIADWNLDADTDAGRDLYSDILDVLEDDLLENVENRDTISAIAAAVKSGVGQTERKLETINKTWEDIERQCGEIDGTDQSFRAEDAYRLINNSLADDSSLGNYRTVIKKTVGVIENIRECLGVNIEQYEPPESNFPDELEESLGKLEEKINELYSTQEDLLDAETNNAVKEEYERFTELEKGAGQAQDRLQSDILDEIDATRRLAQKFDLEEHRAELNEYYSEVSSCDEVSDFVELFREYSDTAEEVREPVRDQLTEDQEQLFTFFLESDQETASADDLWETAVEEFDRNREDLLSDLGTLEENGLIRLDIRVI
jgi:hypothetical protein